jgi:LacI family gluconate utilization system Gnt-I transcriptional repressor
VVSIIVPSLRNAFFAETVTTIQTLLAKEGLQTLVGHTEYAVEREEELVRAALSWAPAGVVLTGLDHTDATQRMLKGSNLPVVEMWEIGRQPIDVNVGLSHHEIGRMAARHLLSVGRQRLAFLGARLHEDRRAWQRSEGFRSECADAGIEAAIITHPAPASTESGGILLSQALATARRFDGFACSNDTVALGALFECQRRRLAVPDALSLIGFGDLEFGSFCVPPLTTIRPSGDLIAREVTRLLLRRIAGETVEKDERVSSIGVCLILRGS